MRRVLVSGGTSTLGISICKKFVEAGDYVYCGYSTSRQKALALRSALGPTLFPTPLDVCSETSIEEVAGNLEGLEVLVNNSGVFSEYEIEQLPIEEVKRIFDINVYGMMRLTQQLVGHLKTSDGAIINVASINAFHPGFGRTVHYDASKGAVVSYTISLARELAPNVRVNAVAPGLLKAPYLDETNPLWAVYEKRSLLNALVDPDQVAMVVDLLSRCTAMTAQVITVDCGYLAG